MSQVTIYHNSRCSKSRQTLELLVQQGVEPVVVEYLKDPPDEPTLRELLKMLGLSPRELMRTKEAAYKELGLAEADDEQLIAAMLAHPLLIERPIVVVGHKAAIGRPPQQVLDLF